MMMEMEFQILMKILMEMALLTMKTMTMMEMELQIVMKSSHKMPVETTVNVQRDLKEWNLSVHQCLQPHRRKPHRRPHWRKWMNQLLFLKKTQSLASSRQLKKKKKKIWRSQKLDNQRVEMELIDFVLNTPPTLWSLYSLRSCYALIFFIQVDIFQCTVLVKNFSCFVS